MLEVLFGGLEASHVAWKPFMEPKNKKNTGGIF